MAGNPTFIKGQEMFIKRLIFFMGSYKQGDCNNKSSVELKMKAIPICSQQANDD